MAKILEGTMQEYSDKTVLVVDDEEDICEIVQTYIRDAGFRVMTACSGREALEITKTSEIDVVVCDVRMPNGDGLFLLDQLKKKATGQPVIFVTGYSDLSVEDALERGAEAIFDKPIDREALVEGVKGCLKADCATGDRRLPRADLPTSLRVSLEGFATADGNFLLNIGRGGMFVTIGEKMPPVGMKIGFNFGFLVEGRLMRVRGTGIVKWQRHPTAGGPPAGIGMEFVSLSEQGDSFVSILFNSAKTRTLVGT